MRQGSQTSPWRRRLAIWCVYAAASVSALALAFAGLMSTSTHYLCTHCRARLNRLSILGVDKDTIEKTGYSAWYDRTYGTHLHHWGWCGSSSGPLGIGCGRSHYVYWLGADDQRRFVQRAGPVTLNHFYAGLDSADPNKQRAAVELALGRPLFPPMP